MFFGRQFILCLEHGFVPDPNLPQLSHLLRAELFYYTLFGTGGQVRLPSTTKPKHSMGLE